MRQYGEDFEAAVEVTDLYGLTPAEQGVALDAMISMQGGFPVTLVNGVAACVDDIDMDAILRLVGEIEEGAEVSETATCPQCGNTGAAGQFELPGSNGGCGCGGKCC